MVTQDTVISHYDGLLADLDGTVWKGKNALPHALETMSALNVPVVYVTNNSSRSPETVATKLEGFGFSASPWDVVTSAEVTIDAVIRAYSDHVKVLVVGSPYLKEACLRAGLTVVESSHDAPDAVIQGYCSDATWGQLSEAVLSIRQGAGFFITNTDQTLPTERGLEIGNGGMARVVADCAETQWVSSGKPQPDMCLMGARRHGMKNPLVVGDRLSTDIGAGIASGFDTLLVLSGVTRLRDLLAPLPKESRPTYVAPDLRGLLMPVEDMNLQPSGGVQTQIQGDTLFLSGGSRETTPLDVVRTVLSVSWDLSGKSSPVTMIDTQEDVLKDLLEMLW